MEPCTCTTTHLGIRIFRELLVAIERAAGRRAALAEKLARLEGQLHARRGLRANDRDRETCPELRITVTVVHLIYRYLHLIYRNYCPVHPIDVRGSDSPRTTVTLHLNALPQRSPVGLNAFHPNSVLGI